MYVTKQLYLSLVDFKHCITPVPKEKKGRCDYWYETQYEIIHRKKKFHQFSHSEATLFKQLQQIHLYNCKIWMVHFKLEIMKTVLRIL